MALDQAAANPYVDFGKGVVADAAPNVRATFIRQTYTHLAIAIYGFAALEWFYFKTFNIDALMNQLMGMRYGILGVIGLFIGASLIADRMARSAVSLSKQYLALGIYVLAQSIIFVPLLWFAQDRTLALTQGVEVSLIPAAACSTLIIFAGLTAIAWFSGQDFSFLRAGLSLGGIIIFALIVVSYFFPLQLGVWFSVGMIGFASAYILYDTSNVIRHYAPTQYVAASLALFASVALLFFYVLRLMIALSSRD
ncbi:Inhibitor of apoptosis-promoting Bax1 [Pseudobythopirellula maris]|uniref:Inhibitor of apoptosis-promoting Bax1 n=1 Tax=Pseudobythopirellula maris TaxID=2527991 RepID=A0A5C5ZT22_9BACT|nr:Bax inhibitor-1 family protein [Pseudobythopirellula maris]TWT90218.1 Inhibitor of apoptosis-promoting Bax1 [Pseudobythopirellula maris]